MAVSTPVREQIESLQLAIPGYEERAVAVFGAAQLAAACIPHDEFLEVFNAAPEMSFHHQYVQSVLTWVWYEVHENKMEVRTLPRPLGEFFAQHERFFATFWY